MIRDGKKIRAKLTDLVIENVGLVDNGANQLADMVISKRVTPAGTVGTGAQVLKIKLKEPANG